MPKRSKSRASALPSFRLGGRLRVPSDKSISHRALIFGALAHGTTDIAGLLESEDVLCTLQAMRALGADIERSGPAGAWRVEGFGGRGPAILQKPLDFGNAGTGVRLAMGLVAGLGIGASFCGDASLSSRPMQRVLAPLQALGVRCESTGGHLPARIHAGPRLAAGKSDLAMASAQVKTALLLAGLHADGVTEIIEPALSRDHSERMLAAFGADIKSEILADGRHLVRLRGPASLQGMRVNVPGDPSSAAFAMAAALAITGSDIVLQGVLMNPARTGFVHVARQMGGRIDTLNRHRSGGEQIADLRIKGSSLHGVEVGAEQVPSMIDEFPALAVLAAAAQGATHMQGIGELRVKESDRLARIQDMLQGTGVQVQSGPDWMRIEGTGAVWGHADTGAVAVRTDGDHRIAMAALVLGLVSFRKIVVDDPACIQTSYPDFAKDMQSLGAKMELASC